MREVIPGILEKNFSDVEKKIDSVKSFATVIHIDFIDNKFASNLTVLDPAFFRKYSGEFFLEAHLMVDEPINYLDGLSRAGFKRFLGHIEKMSSISDFVAKAQTLGETGLALDLETELKELDIRFEDLDVVLLMGVKAGLSGQQFSQKTLEKIKAVRQKTAIPIEVDGGINDKTIIDCKKAGADRFISTSFIFNGEPRSQYDKLLSLVNVQQF